MKKFSLALIVVLVLAGGAFAYFKISGDDEQQGPETVLVETGTIVEKALAVGQIVPRHEIAVKSKVSGTVARVFVEEGDYVEAGQSLIEVKPAPTPLEYAQAKRGERRSAPGQGSARQGHGLARTFGLFGAGVGKNATGLIIGGFGAGIGESAKGVIIGGFGAGIGENLDGAVLGLIGAGVGRNARGLLVGGIGAGVGRDFTGVGIGGVGIGAGRNLTGITIVGGAAGAGRNLKGITLAGIGVGAGDDITGITLGLGGVRAGGRIKGGTFSLLSVGASELKGFTASAFNGFVFEDYWFRRHNDPTIGFSIGLINYAPELKGVQLGLLNYAGNNPKWARLLPFLNAHI
jgi:hypothetical protein